MCCSASGCPGCAGSARWCPGAGNCSTSTPTPCAIGAVLAADGAARPARAGPARAARARRLRRLRACRARRARPAGVGAPPPARWPGGWRPGSAPRLQTPAAIAVGPVPRARRPGGGRPVRARPHHRQAGDAARAGRGRRRRGAGLDHGADPEQTAARLAELPGIGPWTISYILMRAVGDPDAFPGTDLGLRRALGEPRRPRSATPNAGGPGAPTPPCSCGPGHAGTRHERRLSAGSRRGATSRNAARRRQTRNCPRHETKEQSCCPFQPDPGDRPRHPRRGPQPARPRRHAGRGRVHRRPRVAARPPGACAARRGADPPHGRRTWPGW